MKKIGTGILAVFLKNIDFIFRSFINALFLLFIIVIANVGLGDVETTNDFIGMVTFLILWGVLFYGIRVWEKAENNSQHAKQEYREYLVNELEKDKTEKNLKIVSQEKKEENKRDIIALMIKNNDETTEYFTISKKHVKSSYWFSVISCVLGILMLGLAIYAAIAVNNLQLTIIGTVGGAITEAISGTVLWIHNKSALQLNHYYDALHENEKFLSAINIADKLSDEKKEEVYIEIIRKQIETRDSGI